MSPMAKPSLRKPRTKKMNPPSPKSLEKKAPKANYQQTLWSKCFWKMDTQHGRIKYRDWCIMEAVRIERKDPDRVCEIRFREVDGVQECSLWINWVGIEEEDCPWRPGKPKGKKHV